MGSYQIVGIEERSDGGASPIKRYELKLDYRPSLKLLLDEISEKIRQDDPTARGLSAEELLPDIDYEAAHLMLEAILCIQGKIKSALSQAGIEAASHDDSSTLHELIIYMGFTNSDRSGDSDDSFSAHISSHALYITAEDSLEDGGDGRPPEVKAESLCELVKSIVLGATSDLDLSDYYVIKASADAEEIEVKVLEI